MTATPRERDYDVVVVGAGLAGLVAAARAASEGARVGVVALASGNLGLWSGLVGGRPAGRRPAGTDRALEFFLDYALKAGLPYVGGSPDLRLFSPAGHVVQAVAAPATMAATLPARAARRRTGGDGRPPFETSGAGASGAAATAPAAVVVGFTELGDYPAPFIAETAGQEIGLRVIPRSLSLGPAAGRGQAPHLARLFDDPAWFASFLESASRFVGAEARSAAVVLFPPVLGFERFAENLKALRDALGAPVYELPAVPPSVPGQRFWRFWRHRLEADGRVQLHVGRRVTATRVAGGRCLWVEDGVARYRAAAYVLATGGVAGGGLEVDPGTFFRLSGGPGEGQPGALSGSLSAESGDEAPESRGGPAPAPREPLFGLATHGKGTDWLTWGVRVDGEGRPRPARPGDGRAGSRALANVFAAGWVLGCGRGRPTGAYLSIESGHLAGTLAAGLAGSGPGAAGGGARPDE